MRGFVLYDYAYEVFYQGTDDEGCEVWSESFDKAHIFDVEPRLRSWLPDVRIMTYQEAASWSLYCRNS